LFTFLFFIINLYFDPLSYAALVVNDSRHVSPSIARFYFNIITVLPETPLRAPYSHVHVIFTYEYMKEFEF